MRVVIFGAGGQLGRDMVRTCPAGTTAVGLTSSECDVTSDEQVAGVFAADHFDWAINCAAYTAVDRAEDERDIAMRCNRDGAEIVARNAARSGAGVTYISTDYVFDGSASEPIPEDATTNPQTAYGHSKLAGEDAVRAVGDACQIVRTAWLFGNDGPNFVLTMLRKAREGGSLRVVADQWGCPTWTGHLAPAIWRLVAIRAAGTFHLTGAGETTWHGLAAHTLQLAGLETPVLPTATADYPTKAQRPAYSVLDNRAWRCLGERPLPDWKVGVAAYLADAGVLGHPVPSGPAAAEET